jgi:hypothetical protein
VAVLSNAVLVVSPISTHRGIVRLSSFIELCTFRTHCRTFTRGYSKPLNPNGSFRVRVADRDHHRLEQGRAVANASPETFSSGRLNGSMRPAQMQLLRIHERGRMISASTMPPSLRSIVMDRLAQVAWSDLVISEY